MNIDEISDNVERFLSGLKALSSETKIYVGGCGCCGSPYLYFSEKGVGEYRRRVSGVSEEDIISEEGIVANDLEFKSEED